MTVLLLALGIAAAEPGLDAYDFVIAPPSAEVDDGLLVATPTTPGAWAGTALIGATGAMLQLEQGDETRVRVGPRVGLDLAGRLGLGPNKAVGLFFALPIHGWTGEGVRLGDSRIGLAIPLAAELEVQTWVRLPTGAPRLDLGRGTVGGGAQLCGETGWDRLRVGTLAGARSGPKLQTFDAHGGGQALVGLSVTAIPWDLLTVRAEVLGRFSLHWDHEGWTEHPVESALTVRVPLGALSGVAGVVAPLSTGIGAPSGRAFLGVSLGDR